MGSHYGNIMSNINKSYLEVVTWDDIDWGNSYDKVRRIQKRIFKACRLNDKKRVWFLQKLLLRNPHARLIAVQRVTTFNKSKITSGVANKQLNNKQKMELASQLYINGKAEKLIPFFVPPKKEKQVKNTEEKVFRTTSVKDRAKQALCLLALEPEWEAKFEPNSYGLRPGRCAQDAVEAVFLNLHHNVDKYVYRVNVRKSLNEINHDALVKKLDTFPLMESQISAWLKAGIFDQYTNIQEKTMSTLDAPQGGIISSLLVNVALHGLEEHLLDFVSSRKMPKPHEGASRGAKAKRAALGFVRYADDIVIIHRNFEIMQLVIEKTKTWLSEMGLQIQEDKTSLKLSSKTFCFLGFQIAYVKVQDKFRVRITPSKENVLSISRKIGTIISNNKAASAYQLIGKIRPVLLGWANYFKFCECKGTFSKVDNLIYKKLRAWVFRRAIRQGRKVVKEKYFPSGNIYKFQNRTYKANWVLNGTNVTKSKSQSQSQSKSSTIHLPKISWIASEKFVKVRADYSPYDEHELYWNARNPRYSTLSTRRKNLLRIQKGKCKICNNIFMDGDVLEVDHILPKSKGGTDDYSNLQLLHRQCHVKKTKADLNTNVLK
jgi:group II intron reverse transcriptase/maturase